MSAQKRLTTALPVEEVLEKEVVPLMVTPLASFVATNSNVRLPVFPQRHLVPIVARPEGIRPHTVNIFAMLSQTILHRRKVWEWWFTFASVVQEANIPKNARARECVINSVLIQS